MNFLLEIHGSETVTVQPRSSWVVVIVRSCSSVTELVDRAKLRPPPPARELEEALTEELDEDEDELDDRDDALALLPERLDLALVTEPSRATWHSS